MQMPHDFFGWVEEQALPLAIIFGFIALFMTVLALSARKRRLKLIAERAGTNEDTFVESMILYDFDADISRNVYRYLQDHQNISFPIEASDQLDEDLGLDHVDLEETIRDVFRMSHRVYQPGLRHTPLVTVEDLVRFIQASPREAGIAA